MECSAQVVINEIGIAPPDGNANGAEFIEFFNRSACAIDLSCYTLIFSSTSGASNPTGWTIKIPSGYSVPSCGYFLIGGLSGIAGIAGGTGYPTGGTPTAYLGTANLDIGSGTSLTTNSVCILRNLRAGTFPDAGGQLTLFNSSGAIVSSVAYGTGNNAGSYPLSAYITCNVAANSKGTGNIPDPGNSANTVSGIFSSTTNQGIFLNASGVYQGATSLTPGAANPSQLSCVASLNSSITQTNILCNGSANGKINLSVTGGSAPYSFLWSNGATVQNLSGLTAGKYEVVITDANGCVINNSVGIDEPPSLSGIVSAPDVLCSSGKTIITANARGGVPPYQYSIDGVSFQSSNTFSNIGAGLYQIRVKDANNCSTNLAVAVDVMPSTLPGIRYADIMATANVATQLQAREIGMNYTYSWSPSTGLDFTNIRTPVFNHDRPTQYLVSIVSPDGCRVVDTLQVMITSPPSTRSSLYVPSAWTPNNDGLNDRLHPIAENIKELFYFKVFNRWGQLVFETKKVGEGWNGMFNGKQQSAGVYVWVLKAVGTDSVQYQLGGNAVLIR